MEISRRLTHWIDREFPKGSSERVLEVLRDLPDGVIGGQDLERIQASLVIRSGGDWDAFQQRLELAHSDWRDALVGAGPPWSTAVLCRALARPHATDGRSRRHAAGREHSNRRAIRGHSGRIAVHREDALRGSAKAVSDLGGTQHPDILDHSRG